jgi:endonuclease/exonuclease/phosphatase family metal-dependent hydrolase
MLPDPTPFQTALDLTRIYSKGDVPGDFETTRLRVLSWNIERGYAPERLIETLRALEPDVACLQEVDWGNERTRKADVLELLARATGLYGLYGIEFLELPSPLRGTALAGGGVTGNAILTRFPPDRAFRVELPQSLDWQGSGAGLPRSVRQSLEQERRIGRRFGLAVSLRLGRHRLDLCSAHFEDKLGGIAGRWAQFQAAAAALGGEATVIAGDFNTFDCRLARLRTADCDLTALGKPPGLNEAAWWRRRLLPPTGYADPFSEAGWTFKVPPLFRAKLDWIASRGCRVTACGIGPFSSSDHKPIWADLELA